MVRIAIVSILALASCTTGAAPRLVAQHAVGPANGPPGGVLVFSSECAGMENRCPMTWAPAVDAIVTSGLSFHGYATIDPAKVRKDEAQRTETTNVADSTSTTTHESTTKEVGAVAIIPFASYTTSSGKTVSVHQSYEKTVVLTGATFEDLTVEDRRNLIQLLGAGSIMTTHIIVGASWSVWTQAQQVEVMVKLSDAVDGTMRWSARCAASSGDFPSAAAAIEAAARCVTDAIVSPR